MIERGKKTGASAAITTVLNAISQFETDYDRFPQPTSATKGTDCESDTSAAEGLVAVLKGVDKDQNPKETDYLGEVKDAKKVGTATDARHVDGIYRETDEMIALLDPWGSEYKVTLDLDGNKKVNNPDQSDPSSASPELHKTAIVYSAGKDRDPATWKDNVSSWQQ